MISPLTTYRLKNDITVKDLATRLGVDRTTVWRWETGQVPVERVVEVEAVTKIPRRALRPDIFGAAQ